MVRITFHELPPGAQRKSKAGEATVETMQHAADFLKDLFKDGVLSERIERVTLERVR